MFQYIFYFLIAIISTTAGSLTGMGGGVIIKPVLDILGHYNIATIGVLSAVTVFSMSLVSVIKQLSLGMKIDFSISLPLALGSVLGGAVGQTMLKAVLAAAPAESIVTVVQNSILALLILVVCLYMRKKEHIKSLSLSGPAPALLAGITLGVISSFLGIGGGPFNVALIIYLFSFDTKTATVCSLISILFAQTSKLVTVAVFSGLDGLTLTMLPPMVIGAVAGGFIGAGLNKRLSEKTVETCFNGIQLIVLSIAIINIVRNLSLT